MGKVADALAAVDAAVAAATAPDAITLTAAVENATISVTPDAPSSDNLEARSDIAAAIPTDVVAAAATSPEVIVSEHEDSPPVTVDAVYVNTQPNNEEKSNDIPGDQAAASDTDLVPVADGSNIVVSNVVTLSSPSEAIVGVDQAPQGIVKVTPKPMPCTSKSIGSLKHQRNIKAQHIAASTAAFAVSSGLPNDVATKMGTMAADCVAKNFSNNSKSKSYSDTIMNGIENSDNDGWSKGKVKSSNRKAAPVIASHQSLPTNIDHRNKSTKNIGIMRPVQ